MNCANHPELAAAAYCRTCGKPLCGGCENVAQGTIYCSEHAPQPSTSGAYEATRDSAPNPYAAPSAPYGGTPPYTGAGPYSARSASGPSPGLAFLLGLIPGVGAIYNGQYAKGLVHVVILGVLVSMLSANSVDGFEPLFGMVTAAFYFYMPFEAYHTALKRQRGEPVDEFSSVLPFHQNRYSRLPVGPIVLIAMGIVFLLDTMNVIRVYQIFRYWPVFLIVLGVYMLVVRLRGEVPPQPEHIAEARRDF